MALRFLAWGVRSLREPRRTRTIGAAQAPRTPLIQTIFAKPSSVLSDALRIMVNMNRLRRRSAPRSSAAWSRATASAAPSGSPGRRRTRSRDCSSTLAPPAPSTSTRRCASCRAERSSATRSGASPTRSRRTSRSSSEARPVTATCGPGRRSVRTPSSCPHGSLASARSRTRRRSRTTCAAGSRSRVCRSRQTGSLPTVRRSATRSADRPTTRC